MGAAGRGAVRIGVLPLIRPKLFARANRALKGRRSYVKLGVLAVATFLFWSLVFTLFFRMLLYFRGAEGIGDLLAAKMLGLALLTFLMILLLSNVIASLSTFFLARDLEMLAASPADSIHVYWARLLETGVNSSWMVALLVVPILAAYAVMYGAGPGFILLAGGVMFAFFLLPAVVGSALTLALVNLFPARRTRDLLALVAFFGVGAVVVLLRFLRPERLIRPDEFQSLVDFMAALQAPTSPWFPSEWASSAMITWLNGNFDPFPFLLLLSTAAAFLAIGGWLHARFYASGFSRAQEGAERRESRRRRVFWEGLLGGFDLTTRQLLLKEVRVFFRDSTQWSQLILLGVLVVVYVYNIQVLPVSTSEDLSFFLVNLIAFLNLGLAGFVVAAIAARFVFPAISLEGRMTWLLRSSPLRPARLFWTKYWVGTLPILAIAIPLIVVTELILGVSSFLLVLSTITMVAVTLAFTAMALALGAVYPNYKTENPAEIPTSFGGLVFMMAAVSYLAVVIVLEAWPVQRFLQARMVGAPARAEILPLVMGLGGAFVLTVAVIAASLRVGVRRIERTDLLLGDGG
ncbi:MAG: hypothetical protein WD013_04690 [Gemmatimonadota bacterium]